MHVALHLSIFPSSCAQGAAVVLAGWRMLSFILQQDLHRREVNVANFLEDPRTGRKVCLSICCSCLQHAMSACSGRIAGPEVRAEGSKL